MIPPLEEKPLKSEIIKKIAQSLILKSYLSIKEVQSLIPSKGFNQMEILEELQDIFSKIGVILEIIEFNKLDYLTISLENQLESEEFSQKIFSILTVITHLASIYDNNIPINRAIPILQNYKEEIKILETNRLILLPIDEISGEFRYIQITPLGASIVSPIMPKFLELLTDQN